MNPSLALRLVFDSLAATLLLLALPYYLWGNLAHELVGTGMFVLLILHNVFNRRWYGRIRTERRHARGAFNIALTALLLAAVAALLVTSVTTSETVFAFASRDGSVVAKRLHAAAGYWVLVLVSMHIGLRWPIIMSAARDLFRIRRASVARTFLMRVAVSAIAAAGVWGSFKLSIGTKLLMQVTLDWWDFDSSVAGFFLCCAAVGVLYATLTYYGSQWLMRRARARLTARDSALTTSMAGLHLCAIKDTSS